MLRHFFASVRKLRDGPARPYLQAFAKELYQTGYARIAACRHLRAAAHLMHWTRRKGLSPTSLNDTWVESFRHHLPQRHCLGYGRRSPAEPLSGAPANFWLTCTERGSFRRRPRKVDHPGCQCSSTPSVNGCESNAAHPRVRSIPTPSSFATSCKRWVNSPGVIRLTGCASLFWKGAGAGEGPGPEPPSPLSACLSVF